MKYLSLTSLIVIFTNFCIGQLPEMDPSKIEIYITPFYNSTGPVIKVGEHSRGLASDESEEFLNTIHNMKENWSMLSVEELYIGAIRLYDRE